MKKRHHFKEDKYWISILFIILLVAVDFLVKYVVRNYQPKSVSLINYLENTGVVFGILQGNNLIFIIVSIVLILAILYFYNAEKDYKWGFNFILAGAFGNLIDRLSYGYVVDFIDLKFWPVFNLADAFVVIGVLIVLWIYFFKRRR